MSLVVKLQIKVFYFQLEILKEQEQLKELGLPCSLKDVKKRLSKTTAILYKKSNLQVTRCFYQYHPLRLTVVLEGSELKNEAMVPIKDSTNLNLDYVTILTLEIVRKMSMSVKNEILTRNYTFKEIAEEIIVRKWQYNELYRSTSVYKDLLATVASFKISQIDYINDIITGISLL